MSLNHIAKQMKYIPDRVDVNSVFEISKNKNKNFARFEFFPPIP